MTEVMVMFDGRVLVDSLGDLGVKRFCGGMADV